MQEAVLEWRLARRPPLGAWRVEAVRRDCSDDLQPAAQPHPRLGRLYDILTDA